jgi:uncharacterized protein
VTFATAAFLFSVATVGGAINSLAGGGSFIVFPALLFAGVPPIPANATNSVGLWPASLASAIAYRRELRGLGRQVVSLGTAALGGGLAGSVLLLRTPEHSFVKLIPWLLLFATVLYSFGGTIRARARHVKPSLWMAVLAEFVISVYGGYFGGGMGIMMLAVLTLLGMTEIHRMNAIKNVLVTLINGMAVVLFTVAGVVWWAQASVMIAGGISGGYAGVAIARRANTKYVRGAVLVIAWGMSAYFFVRTYILND